MGVQPGDGCPSVAAEAAGDEGDKAPGSDLLHVFAAMLLECRPAALRAHEAGLARGKGRRKVAIARSRVEFAAPAKAEKAGYRPAGDCRP
jgi:hypothetical protein